MVTCRHRVDATARPASALPSGRESAARLLLQGTFGPTRASVAAAVRLGGVAVDDADTSAAQAWVADQLARTPTLLRAHVRRRTNPRVLHDPLAGTVTGACDVGARWNRYAFGTGDIGRTVVLHSDAGHRVFRAETGGITRTEVADIMGTSWPPSCACVDGSTCTSRSHHTEWCYVPSALSCSDGVQSGGTHAWSERACAPDHGAPAPEKLRTGVECKSSRGEVNFGPQSSIEACTQRCRDFPGCGFFLFGTGDRAGQCWKEGDASDEYDECGADGFVSASYDYFKLAHSNTSATPAGGGRQRSRRQDSTARIKEPRTVVIEQANVLGSFGFVWTLSSTTEGVVQPRDKFQAIHLEAGDKVQFRGEPLAEHWFSIEDSATGFPVGVAGLPSDEAAPFETGVWVATPGNFTYFCPPHKSFMRGAIKVTGVGGRGGEHDHRALATRRFPASFVICGVEEGVGGGVELAQAGFATCSRSGSGMVRYRGTTCSLCTANLVASCLSLCGWSDRQPVPRDGSCSGVGARRNVWPRRAARHAVVSPLCFAIQLVEQQHQAQHLVMANPPIDFTAARQDTTQVYGPGDIASQPVWDLDAIIVTGRKGTSKCTGAGACPFFDLRHPIIGSLKQGSSAAVPASVFGFTTCTIRDALGCCCFPGRHGIAFVGVKRARNTTFYRFDRRMKLGAADGGGGGGGGDGTPTCPDPVASVPATFMNERSCVHVQPGAVGDCSPETVGLFSSASMALDNGNILAWFATSHKRVHVARGLRLEQFDRDGEPLRAWVAPCQHGALSRWARVRESGGCSAGNGIVLNEVDADTAGVIAAAITKDASAIRGSPEPCVCLAGSPCANDGLHAPWCYVAPGTPCDDAETQPHSADTLPYVHHQSRGCALARAGVRVRCRRKSRTASEGGAAASCGTLVARESASSLGGSACPIEPPHTSFAEQWRWHRFCCCFHDAVSVPCIGAGTSTRRVLTPARCGRQWHASS